MTTGRALDAEVAEKRGVERLRAELLAALMNYDGSGYNDSGCPTCGPSGNALTSEDVNKIANELLEKMALGAAKGGRE